MPLSPPRSRTHRRIVEAAAGTGVILAIAAAVALAAGSSTAPRTHAGHAATAHPAAALNRLAHEINRAQATIDSSASTSRQLAGAGLVEELAVGTLASAPAATRHAILATLDTSAAASMRTDLAASGSLSAITPRNRRLPPWRIIQPPPPAVLLGYYRIAQARSRVPWQYLAAIELIETRFGRVRGPSSAGAQGPMQFEPSTWAVYGSGSIYDQRQAILAAARLLRANGAPGDMGGALYHYNNSSAYVRAVRAYASLIRADPRAYDGYYYWRVIYPLGRRTLILPVGYPRRRPIPIS